MVWVWSLANLCCYSFHISGVYHRRCALARSSSSPALMAGHQASVPPGKRRKKNPTPEWEFHQALTACSRENDLAGALALYRAAAADPSSRLTAYHFNTLLHICSNALASPVPADPAGAGGADGRSFSSVAAAVEEAFLIFDRMVASGIPPSESTITSMARIAAADEVEGGDRAFELVREMGAKHGVAPRLRTYGPALFAFCRTAEGADKAYAVEEHMASVGISPEEPELAALLRVSSKARRGEKVYEYLHKLRRSVGSVSPSTAEIVKHWFEGECAAEVGGEVWDMGEVKNVVLMNGGGWHGKGWLGKGKWRVQGCNVEPEGCCSCCGERLACVDIDRTETEMFADAVASLAMAREVKNNFRDFQEWLNNHAEYDAIVDGANVGYYHQNFADGGFSLSQVELVIKELLESSHGKRPLVILHNKRVMGLMENPCNRQLLEDWKAQGSLYATPNGSNDDWYWLYASVKLKCLLVTNDEMRDHLFELLGRDFFPRWKERHQVRYNFVKGRLKLGMPPPYTSVIQESEMGSWHLPVDDNSKDEKLQTWICIIRDRLHQNNGEANGVVIRVPDLHSTQSITENVHALRACPTTRMITGDTSHIP